LNYQFDTKPALFLALYCIYNLALFSMSSIKNLFSLSFVLLFCLTCQETKIKEVPHTIIETPPKKEISISLEKYLGKDTIAIGDGSNSSTPIAKLLYTNPLTILTYTLPINNSDTLLNTIISIESPYIIMQHKYDYGDFEFFVFRRGDSVRISYQSDGRPIANILNRKALKYDLGLKDLATNQPMSEDEAYQRHYGIIGIKHLSTERQLSIHAKHNKFITNLKEYYQSLVKRIDSVYALGQMSKETHNVQKTYYTFKALSGDTILSKIKTLSYEEQDSLFQYDFSRRALDFMFNQYGYKPVKVSSGFGITDYKIVMDSVLSHKHLSTYTRDYLLYHWMTKLGQSASLDDVKIYFSKFKQAINNKGLISELESKLLIDLEALRREKETLHLVKNDRTLHSLKEFLVQNRGKIVYVDFWASWCAPCIKEMPASRQLRKDYENAPVTFIYLSIDKDYDAWNKANSQQKLVRYQNSYMIVNNDESSFLKELQLSSIPRYLIFDKEGKLINPNALPPSNSDLKKIFDDLLRL